MNKLILPALLCSLIPAVVMAQPTLTAANMNPFLGDEFSSKVCDTTGVTQQTGGASQVWNFTTLLSTQTDTATAVACAVTPECSLFSLTGSNIAIVTPSASMTTYVNASTTKMSQTGYFASTSQNAVFTDPLDELHYPFTYLNTFTDTYAGILTYGGIPVSEHGTVTVTADGWGTLNLPGGETFTNVLRVHSSQSYIDSANLFGSATIDTLDLETYTWYQPNYHSALLTVSNASHGTTHYKVVSYAARQLRTAVPEVAGIASSVQLNPNPATDKVTLSLDGGKGDNVQVVLMDMAGRQLAVIADEYVQGAKSYSFNTAAYASGLYLVRVSAPSGSVTKKLELR